MNRAGLWVLVSITISAVATGGYVAGRGGVDLPAITSFLLHPPTTAGQQAASVAVLYYRHPDGKFSYSAGPRLTDSGRPYVAVRLGEDVSFDPVPIADASAERTVLYYRNPMGLPDTSPVPKKDGMGMDYIPVYVGEDDASTISLSPGKVQRTGVRSTPVERARLSDPLRAPAVVTLDERLVSILSTRTEAFVEAAAEITTGDHVVAGQPLVHLFAREVITAGAELVTSMRGGGQVDGAVKRLKNLGVPDESIDEIRTTGRVPPRFALRSPRAGFVLERNVTEGMMAETGRTLFRIADTSRVWAIADVPEQAVAALKTGALTAIRVRSLPGQVFHGKVDLIYPEIQAETRTVKARIELANPHGILLPNMYAEAEIETGADDPVLTIPESAIIETGERTYVILDLGEGRFEPRDVSVGIRGRDAVEILTGVREGDKVVTAANFLIDAESNLKAALSSLAGRETRP